MSLAILNTKQNKNIINHLVGEEMLQSLIWFNLVINGREEAEIKVWEEAGKITSSALIIKKQLFGPFFYYYIPRGPRGEKEAVEKLLIALKKEKKSAVFFRIEPTEKNLNLCLKKTFDIQPTKTLILDLNISLEKLLADMHPKTRYNIKLAEKKGVVISMVGPEFFKEFWNLLKKTSARDGFRLHSQKHYQRLLDNLENIKLFLASYDNKVIAGGIFSFFGGKVTYLHGASDNEYRHLMAPYLLQWTVIKEAKKINAQNLSRPVYRYYDFYGISEKKWPGVTRFKRGFGGFTKEYPGTYDFVNRSFIYCFYNLLRRLRRLF